jgi:hypothetical protein
MMDLILYNYCIAQIPQEVAYEYLTDLLLTLRSEGVHVDSNSASEGQRLIPGYSQVNWKDSRFLVHPSERRRTYSACP